MNCHCCGKKSDMLTTLNVAVAPMEDEDDCPLLSVCDECREVTLERKKKAETRMLSLNWRQEWVKDGPFLHRLDWIPNGERV